MTTPINKMRPPMYRFCSFISPPLRCDPSGMDEALDVSSSRLVSSGRLGLIDAA
jgi:hypothetical protein